MAFNPDPELYFPGITFDSAGITIPDTSLNVYDENDSRSIIYNLVQKIYEVYSATSGVDKPESMRVDKVNFSLSANDDTYTHNFSFSFIVKYSGEIEIVPEPSWLVIYAINQTSIEIC